MSLPMSVQELIKFLDGLVPPRCLLREERIEEHLRYAGKRELVEYLIKEYNSNDNDSQFS